MITLQGLASRLRSFLTAYGKFAFCVASVVTAILVGIFVYCNCLILYSAIVTSLIVYWRLPHANIEVSCRIVRIAWACINFILFVIICKLCAFKPIEGYQENIYTIGIFVSMFVNGLLYTDIIPRLSHKMKFVDSGEGWNLDGEKTRSNGGFAHLLIYVIILMTVFVVEQKLINDFLFAKESFVGIESWEKEVYDNNTVYIVKTPKGTFGISPAKYPEIRNINLNTKIKVLKKDSYSMYGVNGYSRIEIKN